MKNNKIDSFFEAQKLVNKFGQKKALQAVNDNLWSNAGTSLEKSYQRAVIHYIANPGDRNRMIKTVVTKWKKKNT